MAVLLADRHRLREQLRREQALHQVVDTAVPVAPRQADHPADRIGLEHGARDVRRRPPPVHRRAALEVERRERPFGADPLEDLRRDIGVLGEDPLLEPWLVELPRHAVPRQLARRQQRQALVVCLEELAARVEEILAPGRVVVGDARMQHEIVIAARDRQRVELDRAEPAEDLAHRLQTTGNGSRRREQVARDEEASCGFGGDLHLRRLTTPWGIAGAPARSAVRAR